ncbi:hypothetical protein KJ885_04670 [Patescibacteria group bacterium]|nr:hypothetical protein [Patescibacteria group bacterium]
MKNGKRFEKFKNKISFAGNEMNLFLLQWKEAMDSVPGIIYPIKMPKDWKFYRLVKRKYIIKVKDKDGRHFWKLTTKGMSIADLIAFGLGKKSKWDKRWRILIFDVEEDRKKYRDFLRRKLKELNFYQLQKSVWITPHPIPEAFAWFLNNYKLADSVHFIVAEEVSNNKKIKEYFELD